MTVVVGYIPTPEGEAALTAAIEQAGRREEPLHVVNAGHGDTTRDERFLGELEVEVLDSRLESAGVEHRVQQLVRGKEPAEELLETARRLDASMIVIGIRRRTPTGKLLFGSQAQRILLDADCPVLAVKAAR